MNGRLTVLVVLLVCFGLLPRYSQAGLLQALGSSVARLMRQVEAGAPEVGKERFGDEPNPAVSNEVSARWGNMKRPPARQGLSGEEAEATSGATFPGVHRHAASHTVFATADAQNPNQEDPKKKSTVKTRARSAMDFPGRPNIASGAPSMPALGVGNLVLAQTFEGATATSMSDGMALPVRTNAKRGESSSWNMITAKPTREYREATTTASWAVTAKPIKSSATSGPANHKFALAQGGSAVAYSQIERSSADALPKNLRRQEEEREQGKDSRFKDDKDEKEQKGEGGDTKEGGESKPEGGNRRLLHLHP